MTLRNLATVLRQLGDDITATLLDAAADAAPDAPATDRPPSAGAPDPVGATSLSSGRAAVLDAARAAIDRQLERA